MGEEQQLAASQCQPTRVPRQLLPPWLHKHPSCLQPPRHHVNPAQWPKAAHNTMSPYLQALEHSRHAVSGGAGGAAIVHLGQAQLHKMECWARLGMLGGGR